MTQVRLDLNSRENAKVERLRALWGLKSKVKAIKKAITDTREETK